MNIQADYVPIGISLGVFCSILLFYLGNRFNSLFRLFLYSTANKKQRKEKTQYNE